MPKSDVWPDAIAIESIGEMDSAESCDSVVSFNSCSSDDSLQYLSAEEKACLLFLEETIESLDTEGDSGLSNDEDDSLPAPGNVANKAAYLSASMEQSKSKDLPKHYIDDPTIFGSTEQSQILNYLVPTPFILANGNGSMPPKPNAVPEKKLPAKVNNAHKSDKLENKGSRIPSEVNVVVIPPPYTPKNNNNARGRGPLSYEGLVELRKNVSTRKTTEAKMQPFKHHDSKVQPKTQVFSQNIYTKESCSKPNPPTVAPKPKTIPSHILNQKENADLNTDSNIHCLSTSPQSRGLMKPEKVRLEALSKLGLLKEKESYLKSSTKQRYNIETSNISRPSPNSVPQLSQSMPLPSCPLSQDSIVVHHHSMTDLTTTQSRPQHVKAAVLEKSVTGLESSTSNRMLSDCYRFNHNSVSQDHSSITEGRDGLGRVQTHGKPQASSRSFIEPSVPSKKSQGPCFNVLMVPNMGDDRREALRKLGLLKN